QWSHLSQATKNLRLPVVEGAMEVLSSQKRGTAAPQCPILCVTVNVDPTTLGVLRNTKLEVRETARARCR
ncbi:hypothetical protein HDU98_005619, partial [Podochytrium sp. JEL0797]